MEALGYQGHWARGVPRAGGSLGLGKRADLGVSTRYKMGAFAGRVCGEESSVMSWRVGETESALMGPVWEGWGSRLWAQPWDSVLRWQRISCQASSWSHDPEEGPG